METTHQNGVTHEVPDSLKPLETLTKYDPTSEANSHQRLQRKKKLCTGCRSLELGVNCFKVKAGSSNDTKNASPEHVTPLRSYTTPQQLGSLSEIRQRSSNCEMCALIIDSVEEAGTRNPIGDYLSAAAEAELEDALCSVSWEIDGREAASTKGHGKNPVNAVRGITRRMHIRWTNPRLSDAYLVYVAPDKSARTASDADRVWAKDSMFLGRNITQDIENQALIRSWLDLCQKSHRGPCRQKNEQQVDRFVEMVSHSYFGVIDVQNMQLTQLPIKPSRDRREDSDEADSDSHDPYVALSYVWGADETAYTTLAENVMLHRMHGGLEDVLHRLPKAIQDAMDLVRRLGFRYMWIDRLCIVQNSSRSWKLNAFNMDLIYGNAALTICAADGDASCGLRAMRPKTRNTKQYKRNINPHLELMVTRPPEIYIRASEWNERAWTFQERLLSRRCLIFTNGRVYFQCRSTGMSEDIFGDQKGAGWSLDLVDAPMQMFRQLDNRAFWVYMKCVELYTERKLTQVKDIQAAFSGMANMMEERMCAPFIHGLPSSHFDLALLWEPVKSVKRRMISTNDNNHTIPDFPSWSWTGWVGETKYHDDLAGGILDNVSQWLDTHTWIQWWVRDGHGDLRPLWDYYQSVEDLSLDSNWRGYTERRVDKEMQSGNLRSRDPRNPPAEDNSSDISESEDADSASVSPRRERSSGVRARIENPIRDTAYGPRQEEGYYVPYGGVRESNNEAQYSRMPRRSPAPRPARTSVPKMSYRRPQGYLRASAAAGAAAAVGSPHYRPPYEYGVPAPAPPPEDLMQQDRQKLRPPVRQSRAEGWRNDAMDAYAEHGPKRSAPKPVAPLNPVHTAAFFDMFFEDNEKDFNITLRDSPYRVVKAPFNPKPETSEFPLLPILQFRTWHTWLNIRQSTPSERQVGERKLLSLDSETGLTRYHITDDVGDWCGSIVLDAEWAAKAGEKQEFIAISEAKSFTLAECPVWTYYIPKEREQSEWDLYYVLLVERKEEKWERAGVGKVFKEAFHSAKQREIMLS